MYRCEFSEPRVLNGLNFTNLKSFGIYGLFGRYNIVIPFNQEVNIFIGENGLGKTTILNCLYYVLKKKFSQLAEVRFDRIRIVFKNRKVYEITKSDVLAYNKKVNGTRRRYDEEFFDNVLLELGISKNTLYHLGEDMFDDLVRKIAHIERVPFYVARKYLYDYMQLNLENRVKNHAKGDYQKVEQLSKAISEFINERIIYLPTYRRIENDFGSLQIRDSDLNNSEMLIRFGMSDVQSSIDGILTKIKELAMQGYNAMTGILLKQYTIGDGFSSEPVSDVNIDTVKIVLDRLGNQIEDEHKSKIMRILQSQDFYTSKYLHLRNLLQKLVSTYDLQRKYDDRIKCFVNTCNKYLNDKYLYYNLSDLTLDVLVEGVSDNVIKLTQLSSGEKQIVSLFSKLYLESEEESIVIIDEPELSLSINWQQMLLPDVMRSQNCKLLLTVTHSPFIFENEFDMDAREMRAHMTKQ